MKKTALFFACLLAGPILAQRPTADLKKLDGSTITPKQIDGIAEKLIVYGKVDGLCISVINGNKAYIKPYGFKDKEKDQLLDPETAFEAGSLSKAVFAYLSMKLVEEKILDLDKPLFEYLGDISQYPNWSPLAEDESWKLITPRMCLSHTSGLPYSRFTNPQTGAEDQTAALKLYYKPETKYVYSNEGFKLLQLTVEKITGKNLEELAIEKVFKPLEMFHSGFVWHSDFDENYAMGYDEKGKPMAKKKTSTPNAANSMVTTVADYTRFIQKILLHQGLHPKVRNEMIAPQIAINSKYQFPSDHPETTEDNKDIQLSYALGWGFFKSKFGRAFFIESHDGAWRHYNVNFPDKNTAIIIMTNSTNAEQIFKELLEKIIGDYETPWQWQGYIPFNYIKK
ncbi:serine hydrolase domain-containing protein [Flavobacterium sp.]|uniref:serine hydrolase domain-containing protein n=1 Tax=Flavobacterium sp. TaxID=239 RepID=UPI0039E37DC7